MIGGVTDSLTISATARSTPLDCTDSSIVGYAVRTTGTLSGTWTVLYSNDFVSGTDDPTSDAKWDTYTLSANPPAAIGSPQTFAVVIDFFEFRWVRMKFNYSSGSGTAIIAGRTK